jgi:hypothetical protein
MHNDAERPHNEKPVSACIASKVLQPLATEVMISPLVTPTQPQTCSSFVIFSTPDAPALDSSIPISPNNKVLRISVMSVAFLIKSK